MLADSMPGPAGAADEHPAASASTPTARNKAAFRPVRTASSLRTRNTVGQRIMRRYRSYVPLIGATPRMTTALRRAGRGAGRAAVVLGAAGIGVAALAGTALAHVTITPGSAPQGSTAELTFKVPNEEQSAATVKLQLQVPTARPIAQFLVKPVPGWTVTVQTVTLAKPVVTDDGSFTTAVSEVTWTGGKILPGQYQD